MINSREIHRLAIPAILFNITEPLIGLVDMAIIGQIGNTSTQAQGGVGLAAGLIATLIWGLAQMRTAISAIISRQFGKNDLPPIISLIPQTLMLGAILSVMVAVGIAFNYEMIAYYLYGQMSELTLYYSNQYYVIRSIGLPLSLLIALFFGVFRGYQNMSWAMYISLIGGLLNIVLDLILVLGIEGYIPAYGVSGAAWASVSAQAVMFVLCIYVLYKNTPFNLKLEVNRNPFFNEMLQIFMNMFVRTIVLNIVFILANRFANKNGDIQLAAYTIGYNIWIFSSFFIDGFANAGNALAGKYLGAKDGATLKVLGNKLLKINLGIASGLSLVYLVLSPVIATYFNNDEAVITAFNATFWIIVLAQPLNSIAFTFDGIFKGMGEAKFLRDTLLIASFLIFIPLLLGLDYLDQGIMAIWYALLGWMLFRGGSLWWMFGRLLKEI